MNLRTTLTKLLIRCIDPIQLDEALSVERIRLNMKSTSIGRGSKFYSSTRVNNFQELKTKIRIGENTHVRGELTLFRHGGEMEIGDFCFIGEGTRIWSADKVVIGNNVLISHNCHICDSNVHELDYIERAKGFKEIVLINHPNEMPLVESSPVIIEDNAWINNNVIVLKGVTIGRGAIVAAGSVVVNHVQPFTIVAGNPAKKVKDIDHITQ